MKRHSSEKPGIILIPDSTGTARARHYRDGSVWEVSWDENGLREARPTAGETSDALWFAPALVDVQVNGYAGVDFQRPCSADDLLRAARALRQAGCWRTLVTLITCDWDLLLEKVRTLRATVCGDPFLRKAFPGWHIEGPFLSEQDGFKGAHNPQWMRDPKPEDMRRLREVTGDDPVLVTLAPERAGSVAAVRAAVECGFQVSFGHSNASAADLWESVQAGGRGFTHLANGCPQSLDRHDNIVWRVWDEPGLVAGIIPDGMHVSPSLFRAMHRVLGPERIYWTTDAMSAAGAGPGTYSIGAIELPVGGDGVVRNPATGGFAGSALEPLEGIRRGAQMLGVSWRKVWDFFSTRPAAFVNLPCDLGEGSPVCLIREE